MTPIAHVAGIPVEETVAMYGPVLLLAAGAASFRVREMFRRQRSRR
jgi:hypothetical protein